MTTNNDAIERKLYQLIGLAQRASLFVSGTELVLKAIKNKKATLVILSSDMSEQAQHKIIQKCETNAIKFVVFGNTMQMSQALGRKRSTGAFTDDGFAENFIKTKGNLHME
ncbi:MAG: L7Ae/L30e/S12e/Gadd45 family ribosomal protein [Bavariicoccus seileri]|uniref:L7Ae/L30e/S12e/Gadd45 family ribosomal protein n=1 Tax=Bavariicoccus seileri TaxID=549685 RepID=UPI0003B5C636|nr:ribosomal L7Ae/L30e/S12e/Gadd45 family protein [Bavariicoccus seileri]